jgi:uncharacterized cupin superfamily protein
MTRRLRSLSRDIFCITRIASLYSMIDSRQGGGMKIDIGKAPLEKGSDYPKPFDEPCRNQSRRRLGAAAGLTQFGVNRLELAPGAWSSQRHWHPEVDEFVYVLRGPVTLVTDAGETILETGDCAGFKAGGADGHHLQIAEAKPP